jgi:hypothetical protein
MRSLEIVILWAVLHFNCHEASQSARRNYQNDNNKTFWKTVQYSEPDSVKGSRTVLFVEILVGSLVCRS